MACPNGRAIHYIFSFLRKKEKDTTTITHATLYKNTTLNSSYKEKKTQQKTLSGMDRVFKKKAATYSPT
jgi:hypothetical protein